MGRATRSAASSGERWVRPGRMLPNPRRLVLCARAKGQDAEIPEAPGLSVSSETD